MRGTGGAEAISTLYIGSSFEAEGTPGETATKQTKHIFMGGTRICSVETTDLEQPTPTEHTFYYHQDHLGSSNVITDETGVVVSIFEYTPYGEVSRNTGNYSTDKRFTGKIWDESSALSYFGARYYDPELGRFITADPTIQRPYDPQDFNRYAYARNNPVKYIDPTGLSWWSAFWNFVAGFFGAVAAVVTFVVTGGNVVAAGAVGGAVSGAILGAVNGGLEGALKGAAIGFAIGGTLGFLGPEVAAVAAIGGAVYAGVSGGLEGLGDFAAGAAGAYSGYYAGQAIVSGSTVLGPQLETSNQTSINDNPEINEKIGSSDFVGVKDTVYNQSNHHTLIDSARIDAKIINDVQEGNLGAGKNPKQSYYAGRGAGGRRGSPPGGRKGGGRRPGKQPEIGPKKPPKPTPGKTGQKHPPEVQDWIDGKRGPLPPPDWPLWSEPPKPLPPTVF